eukprot:4126926-Pyramimonas_sp.AAC.1
MAWQDLPSSPALSKAYEAHLSGVPGLSRALQTLPGLSSAEQVGSGCVGFTRAYQTSPELARAQAYRDLAGLGRACQGLPVLNRLSEA